MCKTTITDALIILSWITLTKGQLIKDVGPYLKEKGYHVLHLDFTDASSSCGYNPLDFIRYNRRTGMYNEQDILKIADALCPNEDDHQPFWDHAARMYLEALVGYVLECPPQAGAYPGIRPETTDGGPADRR